ncbi:MAG TPA: hypothetical protein VNS80_04870, partial [Pseudolysinimonas sp.]|nr:hypothetical protein [Pseudolysinimonas sp.]
EIHLDSEDNAVDELAECRDAGVQTVVDAMPCDGGRDPVRLASIARRSAMHVVAATGLHHRRYYGAGHWSEAIPEEELGGLFIDDIQIGIDRYDYSGPVVDRTSHRAGIIKIATGGAQLGPRDRRLITAAALAHRETGAPILTHCEGGAGAVEQIEALGLLGVPASSVITSHVDKIADAGYLGAIAETGAFLEFDQLCKKDLVTPPSAILIAQLAERGLLGHIVIGNDAAKRSLWHAWGGEPGLGWLARELPGILRGIGLQAADIDALFVGNPARALAMESS